MCSSSICWCTSYSFGFILVLPFTTFVYTRLFLNIFVLTESSNNYFGRWIHLPILVTNYFPNIRHFFAPTTFILLPNHCAKLWWWWWWWKYWWSPIQWMKECWNEGTIPWAAVNISPNPDTCTVKSSCWWWCWQRWWWWWWWWWWRWCEAKNTNCCIAAVALKTEVGKFFTMSGQWSVMTFAIFAF